ALIDPVAGQAIFLQQLKQLAATAAEVDEACGAPDRIRTGDVAKHRQIEGEAGADRLACAAESILEAAIEGLKFVPRAGHGRVRRNHAPTPEHVLDGRDVSDEALDPSVELGKRTHVRLRLVDPPHLLGDLRGRSRDVTRFRLRLVDPPKLSRETSQRVSGEFSLP